MRNIFSLNNANPVVKIVRSLCMLFLVPNVIHLTLCVQMLTNHFTPHFLQTAVLN
jgi:hypothetical protein